MDSVIILSNQDSILIELVYLRYIDQKSIYHNNNYNTMEKIYLNVIEKFIYKYP